VPKVPKYRTLDVFSGCGGLSEGFHQAGKSLLLVGSTVPTLVIIPEALAFLELGTFARGMSPRAGLY